MNVISRNNLKNFEIRPAKSGQITKNGQCVPYNKFYP